jgi:hypothetical protein
MSNAVSLVEGTSKGEDADKGKMFDVPRVGIVIDDADPTVLKLAFSGSVDLDRTNGLEAAFYNDLAAGKPAELVVTVHVAGAQMRHRRDSEGDVDAIVQTKSLVVSDVYLHRPEAS